MIRKLATDLGERGYAVFFYEFCVNAANELCSSTVVGAFFATAGHAILADTPSAAASQYVLHEVTATRLRDRGSMALLVTPDEILTAIAAGENARKLVAFGLPTQGRDAKDP